MIPKVWTKSTKAEMHVRVGSNWPCAHACAQPRIADADADSDVSCDGAGSGHDDDDRGDDDNLM
eukprot:6185234-Pleurochrysis_carterae.AAC.2